MALLLLLLATVRARRHVAYQRVPSCAVGVTRPITTGLPEQSDAGCSGRPGGSRAEPCERSRARVGPRIFGAHPHLFPPTCLIGATVAETACNTCQRLAYILCRRAPIASNSAMANVCTMQKRSECFPGLAEPTRWPSDSDNEDLAVVPKPRPISDEESDP